MVWPQTEQDMTKLTMSRFMLGHQNTFRTWVVVQSLAKCGPTAKFGSRGLKEHTVEILVVVDHLVRLVKFLP